MERDNFPNTVLHGFHLVRTIHQSSINEQLRIEEVSNFRSNAEVVPFLNPVSNDFLFYRNSSFARKEKRKKKRKRKKENSFVIYKRGKEITILG